MALWPPCLRALPHTVPGMPFVPGWPQVHKLILHIFIQVTLLQEDFLGWHTSV